MLQSTKRKSYTKIDTSWKASYINSIQFFILSRRCKSDGCYVYHSHRGPFFPMPTNSVSIDWFISIFHNSDLFISSVCCVVFNVLFVCLRWFYSRLSGVHISIWYHYHFSFTFSVFLFFLCGLTLIASTFDVYADDEVLRINIKYLWQNWKANKKNQIEEFEDGIEFKR